MKKLIAPAFYLIAIALLIFGVWNENIIRSRDIRTENRPLYRNLMDGPAYIRRGFDPTELTKTPSLDTGIWFGFKTVPLIIKNSLLPDLPERTFLSPQGHEEQEFTIIIPVKIDRKARSFLEKSQRPGARPVLPGIFLACIGENWTIYFNGTPVRSEIYLDEEGKIMKGKSLRSISFPIERSLVQQGTNILAFRIIGDPTFNNTGLYYNAPHYMDEYKTIQRQQSKFILTVICSIFGFIGIYCFIIFFYFGNMREIFYLYFSFFSTLICINITMRHGLNIYITDSVILYRMEIAAIMLTMPFFYMFVESLGRGKVTKFTWGFLLFSLYFAITQVFFCNQYGMEAVYVWLIVNELFSTYIIFYDIVYFYFFDKNRKTKIYNEATNSVFINIIIGTLIMYFTGIYEVLDILLFHNSYSIFPYSSFIILVGMCFAMLERFSGMYKELERTNIMLEADFARSIISSGQKHYQKMNSMYDTLRILRHDYKYHLRAIGDLVKSGDIERIKRYLTDIQVQMPEHDMMIFCSNPVANGLLGYYAERCIKLGIAYDFKISDLDTIPISDYEMCIVIGNLLENAVEACQKVSRERKIELEIKTQGLYIAVMVKNSFSGEVVKKNGHPVSTKENGGFGLQSVRTVVVRYNGYIHPKWDKDTFTIYVMLRMKKSEEVS